jgi:aryl-alcohol dehydrogenase-like predicted oxidoreductase
LLNPDNIIESVNKSLIDLKIEHIDCIYIHSVDPKLVTCEVLNKLENLEKAGKISSFGYSGDGQFLNLVVSNFSEIRNFMCTFNIVDQGNYRTIVNNPHLNWVIKRPLANGIWDYGISKKLLSARQLLSGFEISNKSDLYWDRFKILKELGNIEKITLPMLIGYIDRKLPLVKFVAGTRSKKHLSQLLKYSGISNKNLDAITDAWNIMSKNHLEIKI